MGFSKAYPCNNANSKDYPSKYVILEIATLLFLRSLKEMNQKSNLRYTYQLIKNKYKQFKSETVLSSIKREHRVCVKYNFHKRNKVIFDAM